MFMTISDLTEQDLTETPERDRADLLKDVADQVSTYKARINTILGIKESSKSSDMDSWSIKWQWLYSTLHQSEKSWVSRHRHLKLTFLEKMEESEQPLAIWKTAVTRANTCIQRCKGQNYEYDMTTRSQIHAQTGTGHDRYIASYTTRDQTVCHTRQWAVTDKADEVHRWGSYHQLERWSHQAHHTVTWWNDWWGYHWDGPWARCGRAILET